MDCLDLITNDLHIFEHLFFDSFMQVIQMMSSLLGLESLELNNELLIQAIADIMLQAS